MMTTQTIPPQNITARTKIHQVSIMDIGEVWSPVDEWQAILDDSYVTHTKNAIMMPISKYFNLEPSLVLDSFMLTPKRCYNSAEIRKHICLYINYFEKYYDKEHELLYHMYRIKYSIDFGVRHANGTTTPYTVDDFKRDIYTYIMSLSLYTKAFTMISHNYKIDLTYNNKTNEGLQYNNTHGKYLMEISLFQNFLIPLIMHFIYKNNNGNTSNININNLIFEIFNELFNKYTSPAVMAQRNLPPADIFSKIYETAITTMQTHAKSNSTLWNMSEIRGQAPVINANDAINIVIMQVMPKYTFEGNIITYNLASVRNNIRYNVSDIGYEYDFVTLSSSKRDGEDNTSQFDKFEAHLQKIDEALTLYNDYRANKVINYIIDYVGGISQDEINFYKRELMSNGSPLMVKYQQNLINNLFYKFFDDTVSIQSINTDQYVCLIIAAKRLLRASGMILLPYILTAKVLKVSKRTNMSKKELLKIETSYMYNELLMKYMGNTKIIDAFISLVGTTLSSQFTIIDYEHRELNGKELNIDSSILIDEMLQFIVAV